ncbi:MAG: CcmD family protein [Chitinophagales bacterium]|nr:CcmD family protein [Chitinophagales bacterium]
MKTLFLLFNFLFSSLLSASAFDTWMTGSLKYYVTATVLLIILVGVLIFLFLLEKRIKKLEEHK